MKVIHLTNGKECLVDDEDYEYLNQWSWGEGSWGYARRGKPKHEDGRSSIILMHRVILKVPDNLLSDHIDGNRLNNQKSNLRIATPSENQMNKSKRVDNKSGFIGVSFDNYNKKWKAQAMLNGRQKFLGLFKTAVEAAKIRDSFVKNYYGEFGKLNFPD